MTRIAKERVSTVGMDDADQRTLTDAMERVIAKKKVGIARTPSAETSPNKKSSLVKRIGNVERMKNVWTRSVLIDPPAKIPKIAKTLKIASKESVDQRTK